MRLEFTYVPADLAEFAKVRFPNPKTGKPDGRLAKFRTGLVGWVLFIGLSVMLVMLTRTQHTASPAPQPAAPLPEPLRFGQLLLSLIPWLLILSLIWFFLFRQLRGGRAVWTRNKSFHHPHTLELTEDGIDLDSPIALLRWKWHAVTAWAESANLIVVRNVDQVSMIIPKRSADAAQLEALRAILNQRAVPPTGGFPVVAVATPSADRAG